MEIILFIIYIFKWLLVDIVSQPQWYIAMTLSIVGAYYTSSDTKRKRGIGFVVWLISNLIILIGFYNIANYPMVITYIFLEMMNIRGIYSNLFIKKMEGSN